MPAGELLIERVYKALHTDVASTPKDIAERLKTGVPTMRAIRYAVKKLVEDGRARRGKVKPGNRGVEIFAIDPHAKAETKAPEMQASA